VASVSGKGDEGVSDNWRDELPWRVWRRKRKLAESAMFYVCRNAKPLFLRITSHDSGSRCDVRLWEK
jgi:hypothetical protein